MAEADVKLTTVSTGGAKLGSVIPAEALSKSEGKAAIAGQWKIPGVAEPVDLKVTGSDVTSVQKPFGNEPLMAVIEESEEKFGLHVTMGGFPMKAWLKKEGQQSLLSITGLEATCRCEYFNPLSSVKDRLAIAIIEDAEQRGELKPGGTVIEATSGNTGIALAMVCAQRGYNFVSTMAASFSVERRKVMRMMGAKVVVTPAPLGGTGMVLKAEELAEKHGWYLARQFENEANPAYHAKTTGPEILRDFEGKKLDYWVTGYGTGGTFQGAGKVLKEARPDIKIILSEPKGAALITSGIKQERCAPAKGHPAWNPHPIQGWTPNFIPKVTEDGLDLNIHDEILVVDPQQAMKTSMELARLEGIFCGTSGGATVATALEARVRASESCGLQAALCWRWSLTPQSPGPRDTGR
ncbi:unnamed protein product [Effrenium voratum]|nr:unnamed protein product [Effrenium voratum]